MRALIVFVTLSLFMTPALAGKYRDDTIPMQVVPSLDINRYLGTWFEIARFPNRFERNCTGVTANYAKMDNGNISVTNTCFKGALDGEKTVAKGEAWQIGPAKLKVSFVPLPLIKQIASGDYWVIHLDESYSTAVVGDPSGNFGWILSRTPQMTQKAFDRARDALRANGYDTSMLEYVLQQ